MDLNWKQRLLTWYKNDLDDNNTVTRTLEVAPITQVTQGDPHH